MVISRHARLEADRRTGIAGSQVTQADVNVAARRAAELLKPRRGRPESAVLKHHVEASVVAASVVAARYV